MSADDAGLHPNPEAPEPVSLTEIATLFLKLGTVGFGGPAAHIALMEDEVVRRRRWVSPAEFLDLLGATNLIPGPNSTEMAIHIGHRVAGWPGLIVAGSSFIIPAALIVSTLAWVYVQYGSLPEVSGILYGVKPVIIAVVLHAIWRLGRAAIKTKWLALVSAAGVILSLIGINELVVLFGAGAIVGIAKRLIRTPSNKKSGSKTRRALVAFPVALFAQGGAAAGTVS